MFYIGCHLSAAGGFMKMAEQAAEISANTFQFFTRNPRGGQAKDIDENDVISFLKFAEKHNFGKLVAHSPYTVNPCSAKEEVRQFALEILEDDLLRMEYTPGNYYNFHPGSHVGQGTEQGIQFICEALNKVLTADMRTTVLLETMSGKGSEVGSKFEELRLIIDNIDFPDKVGVCLDTCHVNDAGYDIVNNLDGVLEEFDKVIGLDRLFAIHLNDSKNPFESHKDRHEKIGDGFLGIDTMTHIINNKNLKDLPFILETPNEIEGYAKEIELLKSLRQ